MVDSMWQSSTTEEGKGKGGEERLRKEWGRKEGGLLPSFLSLGKPWPAGSRRQCLAEQAATLPVDAGLHHLSGTRATKACNPLPSTPPPHTHTPGRVGTERARRRQAKKGELGIAQFPLPQQFPLAAAPASLEPAASSRARAAAAPARLPTPPLLQLEGLGVRGGGGLARVGRGKGGADYSLLPPSRLFRGIPRALAPRRRPPLPFGTAAPSELPATTAWPHPASLPPPSLPGVLGLVMAAAAAAEPPRHQLGWRSLSLTHSRTLSPPPPPLTLPQQLSLPSFPPSPLPSSCPPPRLSARAPEA